MKKNYKLIFTALSFLSLSLLKAQAPTPDLFHYSFNNTGTLVTNYASSPPPGAGTATIMGAQSQTGAVNCMNALVGSGLSSTTDYVNTGWAPNLGNGAWTLSFWTSSITPSSTLFYILGDINTGSFRMFTNGVAGANNWILRGAGLTDVLLNGAATMSANLVSFVYSPTLATVVGYINGVATTTVTQATLSLTGTGPLKVGGYSSSTGLNAGGLIADFRMYSTALTASDIMNIYNFGAAALSVTATPSVNICAGQNTSLSVSGANSYTWDTGASSTSISVSPSVSTVYTVTGTAGSCTASATSSVNVMNLPVVSVNNGTICNGSTFTISPSGAATYTIQGGNAVVSPSNSTSYSVAGTGTNGCVSAPVTSSVTVNNLPAVSASSSSTLICAGQTASLTASGAATYVWNTTATTAVIAISPTTTTNYTVMGTDVNSCSATFTISQAVSPCTGLTNNTLAGALSVYPNPSNGEFNIVLNSTAVNEVIITDLTGRVILTRNTEEPVLNVNIGDAAAGIYFVTVKNASASETFKLIKQ